MAANAHEQLSWAHYPKRILIIGLFASFIFLVWLVYTFLPVGVDWYPGATWYVGVDWKGIIRPATLGFLTGKSPYAYGAFNPPWAYIPLIPIALLSKELGSAVLFVLNIFIFAFVAYRLGANRYTFAAFIFAPYIWLNSFNGNLDWMAVLGFIMPPQIGLFFVMVKPQIGIGAAIYWFYEAIRKKNLIELFRVFGPITIAYGLSFLVYGFWPNVYRNMPSDPYNTSLWPLAFPIGIAFLVSSLRQHNFKRSLVASPFLAPYINLHSWSVALLGLLDSFPELLAAVIISWVLHLLGYRIVLTPW